MSFINSAVLVHLNPSQLYFYLHEAFFSFLILGINVSVVEGAPGGLLGSHAGHLLFSCYEFQKHFIKTSFTLSSPGKAEF